MLFQKSLLGSMGAHFIFGNVIFKCTLNFTRMGIIVDSCRVQLVHQNDRNCRVGRWTEFLEESTGQRNSRLNLLHSLFFYYSPLWQWNTHERSTGELVKDGCGPFEAVSTITCIIICILVTPLTWYYVTQLHLSFGTTFTSLHLSFHLKIRISDSLIAIAMFFFSFFNSKKKFFFLFGKPILQLQKMKYKAWALPPNQFPNSLIILFHKFSE